MMAIRLQTPAAGGDSEHVARCQDVSKCPQALPPVPPGFAEHPRYGTATTRPTVPSPLRVRRPVRATRLPAPPGRLPELRHLRPVIRNPVLFVKLRLETV